MKKILIALLAIIGICAFLNWRNSDPKAIITNLYKAGHPESGILKYRVYLFGFIPSGEAIIFEPRETDYDGIKVYHLRASAKNLRRYSHFINTTAFFDSYVDVKTLNPILFTQVIKFSGKPDTQKVVMYDQKNLTMTIGTAKRVILANTQDPVSALFNIRRMDLDKVKDFNLNINTNQKNYMLKGAVSAQDLSIGAAVFKIYTAKAKIQRRDKNNPYHRSAVTMVMLKDKENIPVLFKISAGGFPITVKLIDVK